MIFDKGDDSLIEALLTDGLTPAAIAKKWDVTLSQLNSFCRRNAITLPAKQRLEAVRKSRISRQLAEDGKRPSPVVLQIIKMQPTVAPVDIAHRLGKTLNYVNRMIDVFVKGDKIQRHRERVDKIESVAKEFGVSTDKACGMAGYRRAAYQYSQRAIKKALG